MVALLRITANGATMQQLTVDNLELVDSSIVTVDNDLFNITGYGDESMIPQLQDLGCTVAVLMTSAELDEFHARVAGELAPPSDPGTGA